MTSVDLLFPVLGSALPSDQGYAWFASISRVAPSLHDDPHFGLETVAGTARGDGVTIVPKGATLRLRLGADALPVALQLAGKRFVVGGHAVRLGTPHVHALAPAASLYARIVTIKGFLEQEPFREAAERQLGALEISGTFEVGPRRVVRVGQQTIVGFGAAVHGLGDDDSIKLQQVGIGGRRHVGAGVFVPIATSASGAPERGV